MMSEKLISERCKSRVESSELAGCRSNSIQARPMLRWTLTALFVLLALPVLGQAQTTLHTPAADDPQCLERDCPAAPSVSENNADPANGNTRTQARTAPRPAEAMPNGDSSDNNNKNDEQ